MLKIIPLVIVFILITMFIFLKPNQKKEPVANVNSKTKISLNNIEVDISEDYRALGFSGQKKIVTDSKGNLFIAYRKKNNNYYEIFVTKLEMDKDTYHVVFRKNVSNINNKVNQRVPSIAIDSKDNLHLVWYGADSKASEGDREIKYSASKDGGETWSKPINISYVEGYKNQNLWQEHPDIWVGKNDNLFVVWEGKDKETNNQYIKFSKSKDGKDWTKWKDVKFSSSSQSRPAIIQDKNGVFYVFMYSKQKSINSQIWYSISDNEGESWSEWKNISNSNQDSRHLSTTQDLQNNLHLVWREFNPRLGKTQIMYSKFNGKNWSKSEVVSESEAFQFLPHVGVNQDDTLLITWLETDKKSEFPEDDPEEGLSYIVIKKENETSFSKKLLIANDSYFPNIIPKSNIKSSFILFSIKEKTFPILLNEILF